jgi:hypothetical protein
MALFRIGMKGFRTRALAVIAAGVLVALSLSAGVVAADGGGRDHRNAENTFTKWVTAWPGMAGIVGGDVGGGTFAGEVLSATNPTPTSMELNAAYHFNGSRHSFTALVDVLQTGLDFGGTAVITGRVTEGWLKGNLVQGGYTVVHCDQGMCFQGWFDILRGSKPSD